MRRKNKPLFIARVRIEPKTRDGLLALFEYLKSNAPKGAQVLAPQPDHTALYAYYNGYPTKSYKTALAGVEWVTHRKIIKPVGTEIKSVTVQVLEAREGDDWPDGWFDPEGLDRVGFKRPKEKIARGRTDIP